MPISKAITERLPASSRSCACYLQHCPTGPTLRKSIVQRTTPLIYTSSAQSQAQPNPSRSKRRHLSTASRNPVPPPPPTHKTTSSTTVRPTYDTAASEAEQLAFSSLAFTTSIINGGNPIFSSDFENPTTASELPTSGDFAPGIIPDIPYEFAPLPFSTSITNTGDPIEEFEINLIDPSLSRVGTAIPFSAPKATSSLVSPTSTQPTRTNPIDKMSDSDYTAFLEKQSGDNSMGAQREAQGNAKSEFSASSTNTEIPPGLQSIGATYASESDEPFQPVSLALGDQGKVGKRVELAQFRSLTGYEKAEEYRLQSFDPRGEYGEVVEAVKEAGSGEVEVFKVEMKGARVEYWIVSVDEKGKKVVGVRVGSVES